WAAAQIARIAHIDGVALAAFDRGGDRIAAERGRDHVLNVTDHETITGEAITVGNYIEIVAADDALSIGARRAGNRLEHLLDLAGDALHLGKVGTEHLDANRSADAGREHVDPRLDRHGPGVRDAGKLQRLVHFADQAVDRDAGAPFGLGLEVDYRLGHLGRRRISRRRGAPGLAIDRGHFRKRLDDAVLH